MRFKIPTTVGLLSVALGGTGCSDARVLSDAFEDVCKKQCECDQESDFWNEVDNCKAACKGYADAQRAIFKDQFEDNEPCNKLKDIAKKIKDCADKSCANVDECVSGHYQDLSECLGDSYTPYASVDPEMLRTRAIRQELTSQLLYGPIPLECEAEAEDRSQLCDEMTVVSED